MRPRVFFDTNLLIYADDLDAGAKRDRAQDLLDRGISEGTAVLSSQVLQEYFVVATRKLRVPADRARMKVELLARLDVVVVNPDFVLGAIDLHRLHALSFWDALILKCASASGCTKLLSEDLAHGTVVEGVRVENPFLDL